MGLFLMTLVITVHNLVERSMRILMVRGAFAPTETNHYRNPTPLPSTEPSMTWMGESWIAAFPVHMVLAHPYDAQVRTQCSPWA